MMDDRKLLRLLSNDAAMAFFKHMAEGRNNDATVTKAETLEKNLQKSDGTPVSRMEAVAVLKGIADAGGGRYLRGRHTKPTRLEWAVSARQFATRALDLTKGGDQAQAAAVAASPSANGSANHDGFRFRFPLRRDYEVSIELPNDLNADERQRLATAISALPVV